MINEKIKFKDYSPTHKICLSAFYGFMACGALMTAHCIKNHKSVAHPLIGTIVATLAIPVCHWNAREDARLHEQEKIKEFNKQHG